MGCKTCGGGGRARLSAPAATGGIRGGRSRRALGWVHVAVGGGARTPYASEAEVDAAIRLFGGTKEESK